MKYPGFEIPYHDPLFDFASPSGFVAISAEDPLLKEKAQFANSRGQDAWIVERSVLGFNVYLWEGP